MGILRQMRQLLLHRCPPPDPPSDTRQLLADSRARLEHTRRDVAEPLRRLAEENHIAQAIMAQIREGR